MSLATRCPACGTTFKVVRDQLRISDGWVRCGRCSHVFDGGEHLQEASPPVEVTMAPSTPAPPQAASALADVDFFSDTLLRLSSGAPPSGGYAASPLAPPSALTDHVPQPPRAQPVVLETPSPGWPAFTQYAPSATVPVIDFPVEAEALEPRVSPLHDDDNWSRLPSLQLGEVPHRQQVDGHSAEAPLPPEGAEEGVTPSVMLTPSEAATEPTALGAATAATPRARSPGGSSGASRPPRFAPADTAIAPRRVRWRSPLRGAALVALVLLLVAQVLHQERNSIVARQPALRPVFATACEWLGCQLSALRKIAEIRIDGASFAREPGGDGYQFSFTLRNLAPTPLAMPAVELSLLDTQERTVVRRVLRPADYGAPPSIAAHAERVTQLPVTLTAEDAAALPRVAGFRLDAFYP